MSFEIVYHEDVIEKDIPKLSKTDKYRIRKAIEDKLMLSPDVFGKPLRRSLKGYKKLRVGDYRVIFLIENKTIKIFYIAHRSVIYKKVSKRNVK